MTKKTSISKVLRRKAANEILESLSVVEVLPKKELGDQAYKIFDSRVKQVMKLSRNRERVLRKAKIKSLLDALWEQEQKDWRAILTAEPGMSKKTARIIVHKLTSVKW